MPLIVGVDAITIFLLWANSEVRWMASDTGSPSVPALAW